MAHHATCQSTSLSHQTGNCAPKSDVRYPRSVPKPNRYGWDFAGAPGAHDATFDCDRLRVLYI